MELCPLPQRPKMLSYLSVCLSVYVCLCPSHFWMMEFVCTISPWNWMKKCMEYEADGSRPRGRPKRTWREVVQKDKIWYISIDHVSATAYWILPSPGKGAAQMSTFLSLVLSGMVKQWTDLYEIWQLSIDRGSTVSYQICSRLVKESGHQSPPNCESLVKIAIFQRFLFYRV